MRSIWIIARNTYREIIRDRILFGIIIFAFFLIGISVVLGELSFSEQARISANFGFSGIQIGTSILAVFVGSSLVAREIEKQTILTLLARPISRTQFLVGKFLGLSMVMWTVVCGLSLVLLAVVSFLELKLSLGFGVALWGIMLEAMVLLSLALFFGSFARPVMTVIFAGSFFLLGHWVSSLGYFIEKSKSESFKILGTVISYIVPNLETFNWRAAPIYQLEISGYEVLRATGYALGWGLFLMILTSVIFNKKDFI